MRLISINDVTCNVLTMFLSISSFIDMCSKYNIINVGLLCF